MAADESTWSFRERAYVAPAMIVLDILVLELCFYLGYLTREAVLTWFPIPLVAQLYAGVGAGVLILPIAYLLMGLYPGYGFSDVERLRRRIVATAIVFSSLLIWDYLAQDGTWSRGVLLATWMYAMLLGPIAYFLLQKTLIGTGAWGTPVVVVGVRGSGGDLARTLAENRALGLVPVGFLDYDAPATGRTIGGLPVFGTLSRAPEIARRIKFAILALPELAGAQVAELAAKLPFAHVILLPDLAGVQSSWVSPRDLGGVLGLEIKKNLLLKRNRILKRILDYILGVPALLLCLPFLALMSAAIAIISPGNPIYYQVRVGLRGRQIRMYKLRTMHPDAEQRLERHLLSDEAARTEWKSRFKLRDDPRVLPWIGRFLRKSSLDELPQLWNVLRGDMSLVGPRPFPDYHVAEFNREFRDLRCSVWPGLTGLWQVELRSDSDLAKQERLDTLYIRNWSVWLDLYVLFRTFGAVLSGRGAH